MKFVPAGVGSERIHSSSSDAPGPAGAAALRGPPVDVTPIVDESKTDAPIELDEVLGFGDRDTRKARPSAVQIDWAIVQRTRRR